MNAKRILIAIVAIDYLALCAYTLETYGFAGFLRLATANAATIVASTDLVIALTLIMIWLGQDARRRGISSLPYLVVTIALGSLGPLLYLFRITKSEEQAAAGAAQLRRA